VVTGGVLLLLLPPPMLLLLLISDMLTGPIASSQMEMGHSQSTICHSS
jgi:hypothetical protein